MESYNWKAKPISPCLGAHEAHPKTTLYGVVFQKLNGPLLTSIRGRGTASESDYQRSVRALVINLKTAATLGVTVPPLLLATADEVIE